MKAKGSLPELNPSFQGWVKLSRDPGTPRPSTARLPSIQWKGLHLKTGTLEICSRPMLLSAAADSPLGWAFPGTCQRLTPEARQLVPSADPVLSTQHVSGGRRGPSCPLVSPHALGARASRGGTASSGRPCTLGAHPPSCSRAVTPVVCHSTLVRCPPTPAAKGVPAAGSLLHCPHCPLPGRMSSTPLRDAYHGGLGRSSPGTRGSACKMLVGRCSGDKKPSDIRTQRVHHRP